ncbi:V-type ATP synthase subunit D [Candidatus Burarchaeum australiense]|nr:V-type ATP synthase subunit D [Candidatus Burarchaeum australiense]
MAEQVKPTRMELIKARARIRLAKRGHKLLKQKRDALVLEFFKILEKAKDLRSELNRMMELSYGSLAKAEAYDGVFEVESAALAVKKVPAVSIEARNIMGVKIPAMESIDVKKTLAERGYSVVGTSAKVDEAAERFESSLDMVLKLAESENALKKLIREIEKTKRRVNALEYVLIPKLETQAKYISFRLDEMERESFFTLKMIKRKMERKEK